MSNGLAVSRRNNEYIKQLQKEIRSIPGAVLSAATAAGFKAAVSHTYMDSGQFAMNWHIGIGKNPPVIGPVAYRDSGVLKKGSNLSKRGQTGKVFSVQMRMHGLPSSKYAPISKSRLYKEIISSNVSYTSITNPFWDDAYGRGNSYNADGYSSYKSRAAIRPGHMVDKAISQAITRAAHYTMKRINNGESA